VHLHRVRRGVDGLSERHCSHRRGLCYSRLFRNLRQVRQKSARKVLFLLDSNLPNSIAAAPVPSASLVLMLSAYSAAFGSAEGTPEGFAYILAIDWLVDRLRTVFNVTGDHTITAIVGDMVVKKEANRADNLKDEDLELQEDADENIA